MYLNAYILLYKANGDGSVGCGLPVWREAKMGRKKKERGRRLKKRRKKERNKGKKKKKEEEEDEG